MQFSTTQCAGCVYEEVPPEFWLGTIRERNDYRTWLRTGAHRYRYGVAVYNDCTTSNHVHVIVHVDEPEAVSAMMQLASATVARHWNRLKRHEGSLWEHPFLCTIVQDGRHLLNCIRYVSLNMVRAGRAAPHPCEWRWCGDDELMGHRTRYRLLDLERMIQSMDLPSVSAFQRIQSQGMDELLTRRQLAREPVWTEALAVGDRAFVETAANRFPAQTRFS